MFVCEPVLKSLYLAPHHVPGIKYKICAMIGLLKKHCLIVFLTNQVGGKIGNALPLSSMWSPLGAEKKDLSTASLALLARVSIHL